MDRNPQRGRNPGRPARVRHPEPEEENPDEDPLDPIMAALGRRYADPEEDDMSDGEMAAEGEEHEEEYYLDEDEEEEDEEGDEEDEEEPEPDDVEGDVNMEEGQEDDGDDEEADQDGAEAIHRGAASGHLYSRRRRASGRQAEYQNAEDEVEEEEEQRPRRRSQLARRRIVETDNENPRERESSGLNYPIRWASDDEDKFVANERLRRAQRAKVICDSPPPSHDEILSFVFDFLITEGYEEVAQILANESKTKLKQEESDDLLTRVAIKNAILRGDIKEAIKIAEAKIPELYKNDKNLRFNLHQQQLIELIRLDDIDAALEYSSQNLATDEDISSEHMERLEKTFALMAFEKPSESPYNSYLEQQHREEIASKVNECLLGSQNRYTSCRLEAFVKYHTYAQLQLNLNQADVVRGVELDSEKIARSLFELPSF